jgi:CAAX protease family protein
MLRFFSLTFALSWTCFIGALALSGFVRLPVLLLGTFAPGMIALGLTARDDGMPGIEALGHRVSDWPSATRWYLFAITYVAAIKLLAALVFRLATGGWPPFGTTPWFVIAGAIVISTPVQAGEEIGWRGYALPRLAARFGLARASLLLGFVWAVWHLPLFFVPDSSNDGESFPMFVLAVTALSVAMTWLYANTHGSLLLTMLMHSAGNQTAGIVSTRAAIAGHPLVLDTSLIAVLTVTFFWIPALFFLARMPQMAVSFPTRASR